MLKSRLSKQSNFFKFMNKNKESIKLAIYSVVLLLNINMIMSTHVPGVAEGFTSLAAGLQGSMLPSYNGSLAISMIFALTALLGYALQTCLSCILEVPVVIRRIEEAIEDVHRSLKNPRDKRPLGLIFFASLFTVALIVMHKVILFVLIE